MLREVSKVGAGFVDNSGLKQELYAKPAPYAVNDRLME